MTVTVAHAKVVPDAHPNADGVWVRLPDDFETGRVAVRGVKAKSAPTAFDRAAVLFPGHHVVAFRRVPEVTVEEASRPDFASVEDWAVGQL